MYRIGQGFDVHPLVEGRPLHLGCVHFEDADKGLYGHSDADVVAHAIVDALLGALALGDIGSHFPDSDPAYKDFPGSGFLQRVRDVILGHGYKIANIDCTVLSDAVRLGAYKLEMQATIAEHLDIHPRQVSVKATTMESLGPIGRGEAIACQAIALVVKG